jgi:AcrR family transcriptional regulator
VDCHEYHPGVAQATTPNARTLNAARSREAVIDAALELFATQGFDNTTADEIAARAGVSQRTFFRYFDTKDSVVFHRDYGFMRSFAAAYLEQPRSIGDYDALKVAMVAQAEGFSALRSRIETYRAAVSSSPVLVGLEHQHFDDHAETIAAAITARRPKASPEDACALASIALALFQRALQRWLEGPPQIELADLIGEEFDRARRLLA